MITRDNYEEYFLLYVDGELTAEQKAAVEAFVLLHPDLKDELDLLCSTKLHAETIAFDGKEALLAGSMKENTVEESLLLYIDNELPQAEKAALDMRLQNDKAFAAQHALVLKTKLPPELIAYPDKTELYRRTERRLAPVWLRVAAAVLLLTGGAAVWLNSNSSKDTTSVAVVTPKTDGATQQPAVTTKQPTEAQTNATTTGTIAKADVPKTGAPEKKAFVAAANTPALKKHVVETSKEATFSNTHVRDIAKVEPKHQPAPEVAADVPQLAPFHDQIDVTSTNTSAYVVSDGTRKETVPSFPLAVENEPERGGGSMKGILRKATRFIERHTGIKAVNDDNELLVGAVALKL